MKHPIFKFVSLRVVFTAGFVLLLAIVLSCGDKAAYSKGEIVVDDSQSGKALVQTLQTRINAGSGANANGALANANIGANAAGEKLFLQIKVSSSIDEVSWKMPSSWEKGESSGVRFASFKSASGVDVSLVSFPGEVGGIRANLMRWLGQLDSEIPPEGEISRYLNALSEVTSDFGLPYIQLDLQPFANANNIVVGIFRFSDNTLFVKMSGDKNAVAKEKGTFADFLRSFSLTK